MCAPIYSDCSELLVLTYSGGSQADVWHANLKNGINTNLVSSRMEDPEGSADGLDGRATYSYPSSSFAATLDFRDDGHPKLVAKYEVDDVVCGLKLTPTLLCLLENSHFRVLDRATTTCLFSCPINNSFVFSNALHVDDCKSLALASTSAGLILWDLRTGNKVKEVAPFFSQLNTFTSFNPVTFEVAAVSYQENSFQVWSLTGEGTVVKGTTTAPLSCLLLESKLLVGIPNGIEMWDCHSQHKTGVLSLAPLTTSYVWDMHMKDEKELICSYSNSILKICGATSC